MKAFVILCLVAVCLAQTTIVFSKNGLIPEGVDYSPKHQSFFVGSMGLGAVHKLELNGTLTQFSRQGNLVSSVGIQVDEAADLIYVTNNETPGFPPTTPGASVVVVDLDDGSIVDEISLTNLGPSGAAKLLNDITLPDKGNNIYVTDSFNGIIYRVDLDDGDAEEFVNSPTLLGPADLVFFSSGIGANGIELAVDDDGDEFLLVTRTGASEAGTALYRIDLNDNSRTLQPVSLPTVEYPAFDGMYWEKNSGRLYAVAASSTVILLSTSDDWESANVVDRFPLSASTFTTVTLVYDNNGRVSNFAVSPDNFAANGTYSIEQGDDNDRIFEDDTNGSNNSSNNSSNNDSSAASVVSITLIAIVIAFICLF